MYSTQPKWAQGGGPQGPGPKGPVRPTRELQGKGYSILALPENPVDEEEQEIRHGPSCAVP